MAKFYFREDDDERCFLKKDIIAEMKENGITELKITEAKIITGEGCFYCSLMQDVGDVNDNSCGRFCDDYKPRNGKNGRCRFSSHCYEPMRKQK